MFCMNRAICLQNKKRFVEPTLFLSASKFDYSEVQNTPKLLACYGRIQNFVRLVLFGNLYRMNSEILETGNVKVGSQSKENSFFLI